MKEVLNHVPLFALDYGKDEEDAVLGVLRSKWLTMGEETKSFEVEFARYIGVKHAIAVSNCTAALHLAILAAGVGDGDEVICPSMTFVATVNAITYAGGIPVFADLVSEDNWTISPECIDSLISSRTRAIMVMHYGGFSCDMDSINKLARRKGVKVIEDAAHAIGSTCHNRKLGSMGDISCFSFFSNKNLSTGEGGMVCTNDDGTAEKIRLFRSHGMTSMTLDRYKGHAFGYDIVEKGFNYRIDEIHSALGRVQLRKLDRNNLRRLKAAQSYRRLLSEVGEIRIPFERYEHRPNFHIFPILLNRGVNRDKFMRFLREKGIETSIHYKPVHTCSYYVKRFNVPMLPVTEEIGRREMSLPMYPDIKVEAIEQVVSAIKSYLEN